MSCDRMSEWESNNWEDLAEKFIKQNESRWNEFLGAEFQEYEADYSDYVYEMNKDEIELEDR